MAVARDAISSPICSRRRPRAQCSSRSSRAWPTSRSPRPSARAAPTPTSASRARWACRGVELRSGRRTPVTATSSAAAGGGRGGGGGVAAVAAGGGGGGGGFGGGGGGRGDEPDGTPRAAGFGVRVIHSGVWGFASSPIVTEDEIRRITRVAHRSREGQRDRQEGDVRLAPVPAYQVNCVTPMAKDPRNDVRRPTSRQLGCRRSSTRRSR